MGLAGDLAVAAWWGWDVGRIGPPSSPSRFEEARPEGPCQLPILIMEKDDHDLWRSGVDRTLPARQTTTRLGDEGEPILQPDMRLAAASCSKPVQDPAAKLTPIGENQVIDRSAEPTSN